MPKFEKGHRKLGGKKKGTPNKATPIKQAIEAAFHAAGGQKYLERVSKLDPGVFLAFVSKILPKQIEQSGPDGGPIQHRQVNVVKHYLHPDPDPDSTS